MTPHLGYKHIVGGLLLFALLGLMAETTKRQVPPDPAHTSKATHDFLADAMARYCSAMHPGMKCTNTRMTSKHRAILSMHYAHQGAPSRSAVDAVLSAQGWQGPVRIGEREPVYCKAGYGAIYSTSERWVFLSFSAGEEECAVNAAPAGAR